MNQLSKPDIKNAQYAIAYGADKFTLGAVAMSKLNEVDGKTTTYRSLLEERTESMGSAEVDFLWKKMEDGIPYVSVLARPHALEMIKELKVIAQRKHDEELSRDE